MSRRDRDGLPHPVDVHVGQRVRAARQHAGLSLNTVARRVGVAFQQLQKYEAGANRISASMLYDLARALKVPVASFFQGLDGAGDALPCPPELALRLKTALTAPGGAELLEAFLALSCPARRHLLGLLHAMASLRSDAELAARKSNTIDS